MKLYDRRRWRKARRRFLGEHPFCAMCERETRVRRATVVDHIQPHRGDTVLFWAEENWQPLCDTHHSAAKQAEEKSGVERGCDAEGIPFDAGHHWNRDG